MHPECADAGHGENGIVKVDFRELDDGAVEGFPRGEISKLLKRGVDQCGNDIMVSGPCDAFVLIMYRVGPSNEPARAVSHPNTQTTSSA